jgi:hypothetical protein
MTVEKVENEIRVSVRGSLYVLVKQGRELLEANDFILLTGIGNSIPKVVAAIEVLKRSQKGIHQYLNLGNTTLVDENEDDDKTTVERVVTYIRVVLSKGANNKHTGFHQTPVPAEDVLDDEGIEKMIKDAQGPSRSRKGKGKKKSAKPVAETQSKDSKTEKKSRKGKGKRSNKEGAENKGEKTEKPRRSRNRKEKDERSPRSPKVTV